MNQAISQAVRWMALGFSVLAFAGLSAFAGPISSGGEPAKPIAICEATEFGSMDGKLRIDISPAEDVPGKFYVTENHILPNGDVKDATTEVFEKVLETSKSLAFKSTRREESIRIDLETGEGVQMIGDAGTPLSCRLYPFGK